MTIWSDGDVVPEVPARILQQAFAEVEVMGEPSAISDPRSLAIELARVISRKYGTVTEPVALACRIRLAGNRLEDRKLRRSPQFRRLGDEEFRIAVFSAAAAVPIVGDDYNHPAFVQLMDEALTGG